MRSERNGVMHVTGGGFSKLAHVLSDRLDAHVDHTRVLPPQNLFRRLQKQGRLDDETMYRTFNNGVGFVLSVSPENVTDMMAELGLSDSAVIGWVTPGTGKVVIRSAYTREAVVF